MFRIAMPYAGIFGHAQGFCEEGAAKSDLSRAEIMEITHSVRHL